MTSKSNTDIHWNDRAVTETDNRLVNIADLAQRDLENEFIFKHLSESNRVLEVGCGNGFLTQELRKRVSFVDAFDYSENMIAKALELYGEQNNRFFHDNLLSPEKLEGPYDVIVCLRVLINLRNMEEQKKAIKVLSSLLKPGGKLLLLEGYAEGFENLNVVRQNAKIEPLSPASINFYSNVEDMLEFVSEDFDILDNDHLGMFDFLTRVVYPALVGAREATGYSDFHARITPLAKAFNLDALRPLSRMQNFALEKK